MTSVRILTLNIHKGFTIFNRRFILNELRSAMRQTHADVVFLQEVLSTHALHAKHIPGWPEQAHYEYVADTVWPNYAYGRNAVYQDGDHGNALLSKHPFVHYRNVDVSHHGDEKRGLLYGHVEVAGASLHLICVHFGLTAHHRRQQLQQLCTAIQEFIPSHEPLLIAGDFNDWQQAIHSQLCSFAGMSEVFADSFGAPARTFPAWWPLLRLDRIYVRNVRHHQPIELGRKPWSHLSDHVPLAVTIELRDQT